MYVISDYYNRQFLIDNKYMYIDPLKASFSQNSFKCSQNIYMSY